MARPLGDHLFFLRNSADIERVKQLGHRLQTPLFNLVSCPSRSLPDQQPGHTRIGIVVGKRLGKAVVRNRAKRIFRELARHVRHHLIGGQDVLIFPRREALSVRHPLLREAWLAALRRKGLLSAESDLPCNGSASV
ncbi:MAG: ribonuclease P protein component [Nitrospirae bacterium]|nr:ribonuclease P protein component [Nitrospirota bacterium]